MNRMILQCGDGRGKSSSAIGVATRALAHGKKVLAVQFFKPESDSALLFLQKNAADMLTVRNYGSWYFVNKPDEHARELYQNALNEIKKLIVDEKFDVILLDEIFYTVQFGILNVSEILEITEAFDNKCFIMTGRNAPDELVEMADTVSKIECVKHAFEQGIKAQCGIEY